ncbi:hypothetical protein Salat_2799000 [Sesamum alatum]|uniref:Uncharacterized protein n=1 Tax=Sesamum alatum TaxID=300844 RepID=A0AAE1XM10_9LAMI|nr:hypothetical protein Salat_2799000 [Sesamum alatum]
MVRAEEDDEIQKSPLGGTCEDGGQETKSMSIEINTGPLSPLDKSHDQQSDQSRIGCALQRTENIKSPLGKDGSVANPPARGPPSGKDKNKNLFSYTYFQFHNV